MKSFLKSWILMLLCLFLLCPSFCIASEEDEVSLFTLMNTEQPKTAESTDAPDEATKTLPDRVDPKENEADSKEEEQPPETLPDGSVNIILTAAGDLTIGKNAHARGKSIFDKELEKQGGDPSFIMRNIREIFEADDLTLVNFEGTLTTTTNIPKNKRNNSFLFSAPPEYAKILPEGSVEAVSFENNHAMDFGKTGHKDTREAFDQAGVIWSTEDNPGVFNVKGVSIGMLTYQTFNGRYAELFEKVPRDVAAAKQKYDIVIVSYHWGAELDYKPNKNQIKLGRLTIDSGADLVLGHHSHRINPIERYKDRLIAYSLGNFSFAGNSKPSDMCTFILQVKFNVKDGKAKTAGFRIIPARISSKSDYNDMITTPFKERLQIESVISVLKGNGKKLDYAVDNYPIDWE